MVVEAAYTLSTSILPPAYYIHAAVSGAVGLITYAFAQGRTTNRERDLHARTILITGGFTPLGLTLITTLAARGAHIIALTAYPLTEHSLPSLLVPVLRSTTKNEQIFAEYADLSSPESIRAFCTKFLTGEDHRLDAVVFAHEYQGVGSWLRRRRAEDGRRRDEAALATFLITTLLLPKLLVAPVERDIRIVNVVNPFYAAAARVFPVKLTSVLTNSSSTTTSRKEPVFLAEGYRSLRTAIFTRHLQRVLNALPNAGPSPEELKKGQANVKPKMSNIIAVSAAPGMSRSETMAPLLSADRESDFSFIGLLVYVILYPLIWLFAKSSKMAQQSVLHVLFLPTPFKRALAQVDAAATATSEKEKEPEKEKDRTAQGFMFEEVLKPGALYRECAVVNLRLPSLPPPPPTEGTEKGKSKGKEKEVKEDQFVVLDDDGELGGESLGRMVWEWYENGLKEWEADEKAVRDAEKLDEAQKQADEGQGIAGQPNASS